MIAATVSREGASLRPVFIGSLHAVASPVWFGSIWTAMRRVVAGRNVFGWASDIL